MEKQNNGLQLLKKLRDGLMTLEESQFDYNKYVTKFDKKNSCGTVCCALGWAPKFIPESGFYWDKGITIVELECKFNNNIIPIYFEGHKVFNVSYSEFIFMFYGEKNPYTKRNNKKVYGDEFNSTLQQVIKRINLVIKHHDTK